MKATILILLLASVGVLNTADLYQTFYIVCEHQGATIEYDDSVPPVPVDTTENVVLRGIAIGKTDAIMLKKLNAIWARMKADDVDSANVYIFFGQIETSSSVECEFLQPTQLTLADYSTEMRPAYENWGGK
jgi:hypothetical protein